MHNTAGPAVAYEDGWSIYAVHGVRVQPWIIEEPSKITPQVISEERNAEVRRIMIERYGFDRYLNDGNFTMEQQDDFGRLYRKRISGEPDMVFVRVINSTAEPDGTYKEYVLPCRSTVRSAHEAVAQSFGLQVKEYAPSLET